MANAFDPADNPDEMAGPPGGGAPPPPPGGPPGGPPPGGGPLLAMLGRDQMGPPITAPGPGNMAQGMKLLTGAHGLMAQALQMFPPGSPQSKDILDSMKRLSRHMAQEAPGAGAQQTHIGDLLKNIVKSALMQNIMSKRSQGGPQAGGGPGPPQAGVPGAAMPLPGA